MIRRLLSILCRPSPAHDLDAEIAHRRLMLSRKQRDHMERPIPNWLGWPEKKQERKDNVREIKR